MAVLGKSLRTCVCLLAFVLGLAGTSHVLGFFAPKSHGSTLDSKLAHWRKHGDSYDAVYLGSSMVNHHFIPAEFSQVLGAMGQPVKVFNFGMDGMWPPESLFMLREVLAQKNPRLRWVFIELMDFKPTLEGNEESERTLAWHDWRHTILVSRHILSERIPGQRTALERMDLLAQNWTLFARQSLHLGGGQTWLGMQLKLLREKKPRPLKDDGYEAGEAHGLDGERRTVLLQKVEKLRKAEARPIPPVLRDALNDAASVVCNAGAQPIFVLSPSLYSAERFNNWPPSDQPFFNFNDPLVYPGLYDPAHRYDLNHLNPDGALEFTRVFARKFGDWLQHR
jgi:hypothetical protein